MCTICVSSSVKSLLITFAHFFFLVGCRIHSWGILYVLRMLIVLSLACNIAGDSGCFSGYCSQDVGQDRYHIKALSRALEFQDPLRDCWQASVSCQVKIFIWMPTAWPLAPAVSDPREKTQDRSCSLLIRGDTPLLLLYAIGGADQPCVMWDNTRVWTPSWRLSAILIFCHFYVLLISSLCSFNLW